MVKISIHTPAPWEVNTEAGHPVREVFMGDQLICDCGVGGYAYEETEANARLIAAAPELLESLREMVAFCIRDTDYLARAKAAIAKAEGR